MGGSVLPFVGREPELAALSAALDEVVATGRGRIVVVSGEPGAGKTRLVRQFLAGAGNLPVAWAGCAESAAVPFRPWRHLLDTLLPNEPLLDVVGPGDEHAPELARSRLFACIADRLAVRFGSNRPAPGAAVAVLDDAQWADEASLQLLGFVIGELGALALLVVVVHRTAAADDQPIAAVLGAAARADSVRLRLGGLSAADVGALLAATGAPADGLPEELVRRTGGNALYLSELVRSGGLGALGDGGLPAQVRDLVSWRIRSLPAPVGEVLTGAALLGREFDAVVVADTIGASLVGVLDALVEAERSGLVEPLPARPAGWYSFVHDVVREARYASLTAGERLRLHARCLEALERASSAPADGPVDGLSSSVLVELARHGLASAPLDRGRRGVRYALAAADREVTSLAFEDAARLLEQVRALVEAAPGGYPGTATPGTVALRVAEAWRLAGRVEAARTAYRAAAAHARVERDAGTLAEAALGLGRSSFADTWLASGYVDEELVALLEEALHALPASDASTRSRLLGRLATALYYSPRRQERVAMTAEAVALAQAAGDDGALAFALLNRCWALWDPDGTRARLTTSADAVSLAERIHDANLAAEAQHLRMTYCLEAGDVDGFRTARAEFATLVARLGHASRRYPSMVADSMVSTMEGRFDEGEALADAFLELGRPLQLQHALQSHTVSRFVRLRSTGRGRELVEELEATVAAFPTVAAWQCALAVVYADADRREDAARLLTALAADGFTSVNRDWCWLVGMACAAEAAALIGDLDAARPLRDLLGAVDAEVVVIADAVGFYGPRAYYLGLLELALGDVEAARAHLASAVGLCERLGARPMLALARLAYARALEGDGDCGPRPVESRAQREAAHALLVELGLAPIEPPLPPATRPAMGSGALPFGLTAREVEVLALVADGCTAAEIGARLHISRHTAANHVKRVLHKTGAANRAEAAAMAVRAGLVDRP